jgi:hypothetical protein
MKGEAGEASILVMCHTPELAYQIKSLPAKSTQVNTVAGETSILVMCHTRELAYQIRTASVHSCNFIGERTNVDEVQLLYTAPFNDILRSQVELSRHGLGFNPFQSIDTFRLTFPLPPFINL